MSELRVRIGPSVDRAAFDAAFSSISAAAKRAFDKVATDAQRAAAAETQAVRQGVEQTQRVRQTASRSQETEAQRMQRTLERSERMKVQLAERAARERMTAEVTYYRGLDRLQREAERSSARMYDEMKRQARDAAKAAQVRANPRFAMSLGHGVSLGMSGAWGLGAGAMRMGMGIAGDIAHAYGVDTSLGSYVHKNADLETLATQITNEAHEKGQSYANASDLKRQALDVGIQTGTSANDIMEGIQGFVGKTGDLKTAQDIILEMGKIAKATGSSLQDMVSAAADVSNQLGDIPNKGEKVNEVMRVLAGEAKLGAVPMRALASQAAKVVASAQLMEGDVTKNMGLLGAVAQESRMRGGSASPQQAATSVSSLMATFTKGARVDAFKNAGISLVGAGGKQRNVEDVIVESLQKTQKGNASDSNVALGKLFMDVRARSAVRGFESIFRSTYSESKGTEQERLAEATKAVRAEFERLQNAAMDQKEVDESFARALATGQSQATVLNNQLQKLADTTMTQMLPAFIKLVPILAGAADTLGRFVNFMAGPDKADATSVNADKKALQAAIKSGKITQGVLDKSKQDTHELLLKSYGKQTEAKNLRDEAHGGVIETNLKARALGAAHGVGAYFSGDKVPWYLKAAGLVSGGLQAAAVTGAARADTGQYRADKERAATAAQQEGDAGEKAAQETRALLQHIQQNPLYVRIVADDTQSNGAANPSTDTLGSSPSGP